MLYIGLNSPLPHAITYTKLFLIPILRCKFSSSTVLGTSLTDLTEAVWVLVAVQLFTELMGRMPFPENLIPFCSHRCFTGLTGAPGIHAVCGQKLDHGPNMATVIMECLHEVYQDEQRHWGLAPWAESLCSRKVTTSILPAD